MNEASEKSICRLNIDGMDCPGCAAKIEKNVRKLPEVSEARVDYLNQTIEAKVEQKDQRKLWKAIEELGYKIKPNDLPTGKSNGRFNFDSESISITTAAFALILAGVGSLLHWHDLLILFLILSAIFTGGRKIVRKGLAAGIRLQLDIDFLMTIAVAGALIIGEWIEAGAIIVLFSLSEYLEHKSIDRSRRAIKALSQLTPQQAAVLIDGNETLTPIKDIQTGQQILVRPGERVPLDGVILSGESSFNQAAITGESLPVFKKRDDKILAGSINGENAVTISVSHESGETVIDKIVQLVREAQSKRAETQTFIESFAKYYTPAVVGIALIIALFPPLLFSGVWSEWIYRALALLVIACPCALVISTPITFVSALTGATKRGVLIKGGVYLEKLYKIRAIAFDKTGTLTKGNLAVKEIIPLNRHNSDEVLKIAASVELHSEHPAAKSIVECAKRQNIRIDQPEDFKALPGLGAQAEIDGKITYVGNHHLFHESNRCDKAVHTTLDKIGEDPVTSVLVGRDSEIIGIITLEDEIRRNAATVISELKAENVTHTTLITGDLKKIGENIGGRIGVDEIASDLLPHQKVQHIQRLKQKYGSVVMAGDGINDAAALATADIGIAMGRSGADVTLETADIVLLSDKIEALPWLFRLSRKSYRIIVTNIFFAILVKALFILLAITGNATLWMAVFADMGVSLMVIFNGMRTLKTR